MFIKIVEIFKYSSKILFPMVKLNLPKSSMVANAVLWKRGVAFIIDLFIINFIIIGPFRSIIQKLIPSDSFSETYSYIQQNPALSNKIMALSIVIGVLILLYFMLFEYKLKQTIGKMIMNVYVISDLKELRLWQCFIRNLLFIPIFPLPLLWIADIVFLLWKNIRFSEVISKTRLVEKYLMR